MKKSILSLVKKVYVFIFARRAFYSLNTILYELTLNSLGIFNFENDHLSGEKAFIDYLITSKRLEKGVIFDVGANVGDYSIMLRNNNIKAPIYSFEPHPLTYQKLELAAKQHNFTPVRLGAGERSEFIKIYDYSASEGSQHASIFKEVIEEIHKSKSREFDIELTTIDSFVKTNNITNIALLKIDTEGNEKNVLKGAAESIRAGIIDVVQIEFNEMNVVSRTFMKDLVDMLPSYKFYRLLPDGMVALGNYNALIFEIFAFQNVVAIKQ